MQERSSKFYQSAKKIWGAVVKRDALGPIELNQQLELHKRLLNVFQIGRHYYMIFNVYRSELEFISTEIADVLGYNAEEMNAGFFLECIHPDDKPYFLGFEGRAAQFFRDLSVEKRSSYKYQHDYRIKTKGGTYIRLLHQILPLEYDQDNIYRSLVLHTDISHIKPDGCPTLSIIGLDGEPSYYNIQDALVVFKTNDIFTKRERQILNYIVEGKTSKEIAGELFISLHTVNAHRKNILDKAGAKTPFELVNKVLMEGWI